MNRTTRIAIVAGILLIVAGIWAMKNIDFSKDSQMAQTEGQSESTETIPATEAVQEETPADAEATEAAESSDTKEVAATLEDDLVLKVDTIDFDAFLAYGKPMILDFGADDCVPCQQMAPDLAAFHEENKEKATIKYFDVWEKPELAAGYPIQVVPTQLFFLPDGSPYDPGDHMDDSGIRFSLYISRETDQHELTGHAGILTREQLEAILKDMESQVE